MYIVVVGVNHRSAPVEIREVLSFSDLHMMEQLVVLRGMPSITEAVLLSTCNRTEVYAVATDLGQGLASVREFLSRRSGVDLFQLQNYTYSHTLYEAIRHLFRVVCGLDSMLLGETQVLGQVRDAYRAAVGAGTTGVVFNTLFQQALAVGKRVRS
ncbi:MAG TPA: glutamyl-tRNA reductase, partial [Spirochaetia bacterium]|nr:glutamyl-tRNA reductase [Spirochaetia bacterium]